MYHYLISSSNVNKDTLFLSLKAKDSRDIFKFRPGQYVCISFRQISRKSPYRCFSITSVPGGDEISFGLRMSGRFTRKLSKLPIGTKIDVMGPYGDFYINPRYDDSVVMIAGGIGVTPFVSMIRSSISSKNPLPILLLYSARKSSDMPFIAELVELSKKNSQLKIAPFITEEEDLKLEVSPIKGFIEKSFMEKIVKQDYLKNTYFICGPKNFTSAILSFLEQLGVGEERIITESFAESSQIRTYSGRSISSLTYIGAAALILFGIVSIAMLDLFKYVPKHVTPESSTKNNSLSNTNSSNSVNSNTTNATTNNNASSQTNNSYQAPTSHVS